MAPVKALPLHVHFEKFHILLRYQFYELMTQINRQFRFDSIADFVVASQGLMYSKSSCLNGFLENAWGIIRPRRFLGRLSKMIVVSRMTAMA